MRLTADTYLAVALPLGAAAVLCCACVALCTDRRYDALDALLPKQRDKDVPQRMTSHPRIDGYATEAPMSGLSEIKAQ